MIAPLPDDLPAGVDQPQPERRGDEQEHELRAPGRRGVGKREDVVRIEQGEQQADQRRLPEQRADRPPVAPEGVRVAPDQGRRLAEEGAAGEQGEAAGRAGFRVGGPGGGGVGGSISSAAP